MFKIDQVKNLFDCDQCNQLLVDPIALPCGNSVCKKHVDEERLKIDKKYVSKNKIGQIRKRWLISFIET